MGDVKTVRASMVLGPVLFLDVDGVLNSMAWMHERRGQGLLYPHSSFDPAAVKELNRILAETGAEMVMSSSWRIGYRTPALAKLLADVGVVGRLIGRTPYHVHAGAHRGGEIASWLDCAPLLPRSIAILDDSEDMGSLAGQLVRTGFDFGLTPAKADEAIEMLLKPTAYPPPFDNERGYEPRVETHINPEDR